MSKDKQSGGPHFEKDSTLAQKIKEKFSTLILPIIAALVLATGIFLYYQMQPDNNSQSELAAPENQEETESVELANLLTSEPEKKIETETAPTQSEIQAPQTEIKPTTEDLTKNSTEKLSEISTRRIIRKTANAGEGITHLARRALATYLEENQDLSLSAEQKIFIEDYLKDQTDKHSLEIGESVEFDRQLIAQAVELSQQLTQKQIEIISQFTPLVPQL